MRISFQNVSFEYTGKVLLDNLNIDVAAGEHVCIVGPSGIGKSTLINAVVGMARPSKGEIHVGEYVVQSCNIDKIRSHVSWLPQEYNFPFRSANEVLKLPFELKVNRDKVMSEPRIEALMHQFGLSTELRFTNWNQLSGGERQRFMLIALLQLDRPILLLDEPTSALDPSNREAVSAYLQAMKGVTIIAITHDHAFTARFDRIITLNR